MKQTLLHWFASTRVRACSAGLAGFVAYGGWGCWINLEHGEGAAVLAGLVQGSYSFCLTFTSTLLMESLFAWLKPFPLPFVTTTVLMSTTLFVVAFSLQLAVGTPEVLLTILPGCVVGTVYAAVYVAAMAKLSARASRAETL